MKTLWKKLITIVHETLFFIGLYYQDKYESRRTGKRIRYNQRQGGEVNLFAKEMKLYTYSFFTLVALTFIIPLGYNTLDCLTSYFQTEQLSLMTPEELNIPDALVFCRSGSMDIKKATFQQGFNKIYSWLGVKISASIDKDQKRKITIDSLSIDLSIALMLISIILLPVGPVTLAQYRGFLFLSLASGAFAVLLHLLIDLLFHIHLGL